MIKKQVKKVSLTTFIIHIFQNHNRAFHINNLQKGVEKNILGVEGVDFAERGRSTPRGVGVGRSVICMNHSMVSMVSPKTHSVKHGVSTLQGRTSQSV